MLQDISYYMIFGKPFIMYLGIVVFSLFIATATVGALIFKGKAIPMKWHQMLAGTAIGLGIFHAILGILIFF